MIDPDDAEPAPQRRELSVAQRMLWTGQRLCPESPMYNMALALQLDAPIDVERFRWA